MAAVSEPQVLLSVKENTSELKALDSDSDSGQGSCEASSPNHQLERMDFIQNGDSDDEILVHKKTKSKKLFEESDSDPEAETSTIAARDELDPESEEDNVNKTVEKGKPRRILTALVDSDDTDEDNARELDADSKKLHSIGGNSRDSPQKEFLGSKQKRSHKSKKQTGLEEKPKGKSERRREKENKKLKAIEKLKEGKPKSSKVQAEEGPLMNDSGCLLADGDLFDKDDESDNEEEESLEAIRASLKNKFKSGRSRSFEEEDVVHEEESEGFNDQFEKKKERKAARASKEAIKKIHSETQRLLRESAVSLPYHLPEPKTIHDFFKRRSRPLCQGNAMQLIKSSKYQPCNADDKDESNPTEPVENSFPVAQITPQPEVPLQDPQVSEESALVNLVAEPDINTELHVTENKANDVCNFDKTPELVCMGDSSQPICNTENKEPVEKVTNDDLQNVLALEVKNSTCEQSKVTENACTNEPPTQVKPKLSKAERLRALGIDLSVKPLLRPDDGTFVNLEEPKPNKELEALKERFLKHSMHKVKAAAEKKVNLHIVRKERTEDGKEELKTDVVPVTIEAENLEEKIVKPGEKLQVLKAKLQEAMKLRRDEERQKRQALFKLDNEDLDGEEEEEEEMTDESEEEEYEEDGNEEEMEHEKEGNVETLEDLLGDGGNEEDEAKDGLQNSSIPDRSIPVATESTLMLFKDNSTKIDDSIPDKIDHSGCKENCKLGDEEDFLLPLTKDNSHNSSFELIGSMLPSYQPFSKTGRGSLQPSIGDFRSPSPVNFKANFLSSASKSSGKISEPSLPVEDSQDLYNASPEPKASYLGAGGDSQFQFSLEDDTQSQLLDADGFLNVGHNRSKYSSAKQRLVMDNMDENAMDANMGELLDLCSGKFKESQSDTSQPDANGTKIGAMDELLGLCSGKFVSQDDGSNQESFSCTKAHAENEKNDLMSEAVALCSGSFTNRENEENEAELEDFHLLPCDDSDSEEFAGIESGAEDGEENEECVEDDDDEEAILRTQSKKRKLNLQDFMENEAELSGSDVGSEDEDEGDEDEYEEEAIDEELPSDEELQDQINKIHMKVTMDEDKRRLRLYQERYLADGDLHSDGPGRMRKFRWKNIDDASQFDMFRRDSDLEDQEGENEDLEDTDLKWRKERFEREQWLREQSKSGSLDKKEEEEEDIGTDSQFMKLAKKVTERTLQRKATVETKEPSNTTSKNPFGVNQPFSLPKMKTGSMLNMPKDVLQKLAAMSTLNPNAPRNSRNFVFQTVSPQKQDRSAEKPKSKVRKNISAATPSPKRFKSNSSTSANSKSRSIFPLLEN
ncbi:claspin [Aquarana catesbeiana]|uniref:claspin n=1 Tax=Aquarana catesbeiana TaxID=8400 RepID=UPI003CC9C4E6